MSSLITSRVSRRNLIKSRIMSGSELTSLHALRLFAPSPQYNIHPATNKGSKAFIFSRPINWYVCLRFNHAAAMLLPRLAAIALSGCLVHNGKATSRVQTETELGATFKIRAIALTDPPSARNCRASAFSSTFAMLNLPRWCGGYIELRIQLPTSSIPRHSIE